ncbi:LysM peptidoglycan-binding domain-containing protein [Tropicibacter sp. Alg240-R139]|uniref:LysM peptidoglycan-binding domain-containing protein n=1 Tax=Tropicibacter sp. Alg240-R139 TaxID=2305991 RepID=UPI0013DFB8EF|nr:LysM peptidoglycan-binding domain-containing protein [Tropicibacter sp. Alg240-R139]
MAASAGAGGLSALGWVVVAGGVAVAGAAGLYFSGVLTPAPEVEQVVVVDTKPEDAPAKAVEATDPVVEAPAPVGASDPEPAEDVSETAEPEADPAPEETESNQTTEADPEATTEPEVAPEPVVPPLAAPSLDTIRIEPDGSAVLAGKAAPGSELSVHLDGQEIERAQVDRSGAFALFLTLPFSDAPRGLNLTAELDGQTAQSDDYLLAALPKPRPVQVAEAVAEPEEQAPATEAAQTDPQQEVETSSLEPQPETTANTAEAGQVAEVEAPADPTPVDDAPDSESAETQDSAPEPVQVAEAEQSADPEPVQDTELAQSTAAPSEESAEDSTAQVAANAANAAEEASAAETGIVIYETASESEEAVEEEPRAVAILKSDEKGVELVQAPTPATPDAKVQIALDTIGYSDAGDVQLTGRATQGALVRVYLNNLAVSDVVTDTEGRWRGQLDDVSPGIYTLRVDELGPGDVVLSRLETPFKREAPEVLLPKAAEPGIAPETPAIRAVTVQKGDTLWAISRARYGDGVLYVKVFEANRGAIRNPDLIYPGQVFNIPE